MVNQKSKDVYFPEMNLKYIGFRKNTCRDTKINIPFMLTNVTQCKKMFP